MIAHGCVRCNGPMNDNGIGYSEPICMTCGWVDYGAPEPRRERTQRRFDQKSCDLCGEDISQRGANSQFCLPCLAVRKTFQDLKREPKRHRRIFVQCIRELRTTTGKAYQCMKPAEIPSHLPKVCQDCYSLERTVR